ncbi:MAG: O-succinylhomoserine sulfhydrylase [Pseudomonadales bacterium]|nr:O-succinylhomoserine sulfhydrylase [Pseudomonadales bacterium]MCP5214658.1 O-succinylhomoserine sulfhydrylase [Pseudomonadales bacterium]
MSEQDTLKETAEASYRLETLAIRSGHPHTGEQEHSEPIFPTSSFVFSSAAEAAAKFAGDIPGNIYSRFTNPTVRNFEQRLAALEGVERCVATASGMAAIMSTCMALLKSGDHVVCSRSVFGTTFTLLNKFMSKFGVTTTFVELTAQEEWRQALRPETKLLLVETPSNPLCEVADIQWLADLAHSKNALLVVDNCFCTPALQQPFKFGADIVVHSATKYLDGQGRCVGGAVLARNEIAEEIFGFLRAAGPSMSPFNAWVFLKGLETLKLRMDAHSHNTLNIAHWLEAQPAIEKVYYSGLPSHPQHGLASKQQRGFGGVLSFQVIGDKNAAWRFIDATAMLSITANLGDVKTTITHPATTTHGKLTAEEKLASGITDNLIRVAVGLEDIEDIKVDLSRGLAAI